MRYVCLFVTIFFQLICAAKKWVLSLQRLGLVSRRIWSNPLLAWWFVFHLCSVAKLIYFKILDLLSYYLILFQLKKIYIYVCHGLCNFSILLGITMDTRKLKDKKIWSWLLGRLQVNWDKVNIPEKFLIMLYSIRLWV